MSPSKIQSDRTPDAAASYKAKHSVARNEGFAIVIALSLMSMVLLMLVTLTALARVESQAAQIHQKKLLAKENARLGLMIALGNLQRYAGPDQRVTANAGIDSAHTPSSKFWSGVWASDPNAIITDEPIWLASGIPDINTGNLQTNPFSVTPSNPVQVFPSTAVESEVIVEAIPIIDKNSNTSGEIAYWLSDEASKVRLNLKPESEEMSYLPAAEDRQNINESYLSFPAQDKIFSGISPLSIVQVEDFARVLNPNQIDHIIPAQADSSNQTILDASHDFTTRSASVITDMGKGGLKKNLTGRTRAELDDILQQSDYQNDNYLSGDYLAHYNINPITGNPNYEFSDPDESDLAVSHFTNSGAIARQAVDDFFEYKDTNTNPDDSQAVPVHTAMPIISEVSFRMGAFHIQSQAKHKIRFHVDVEFWNPYPYPIQFPADEDNWVKDRCFIAMLLPSNIGSDSSNAEKMILSIENTTENEEIHTNLFNFDEDLGSVLGGGLNVNETKETVMSSWMIIENVTLQPGEVYHASTGQSQGLARDLGGYRLKIGGDENNSADYEIDLDHDYNKWSWHTVGNPTYTVLEDTDQIEINLRMPPSGLTFRIIPFDESSQIEENSPVYEELQNDWSTPMWELRNIYKGDNPPSKLMTGDDYSRAKSSDYTLNNFNIGFHFRLADELIAGATPDASDLSLRFDLRQPVWDYDNPAVQEVVEISEDPFAVAYLANVFDGTDFLADNKIDSHEDGSQTAYLYDLPKEEPKSIGALRHLPLSYETIKYDGADYSSSSNLVQQAIGTPWGGQYNEAFDKYFYTGAPASMWTAELPLGVAQLKPIENASIADMRSEDAAELLLFEGGFNLNSISQKAWEAMLSQNIYDWNDGSAKVNLSNTFLNLSTATDDAIQAEGGLVEENAFHSGSNTDNGRLALRQPLRQVTDAQIQLLAEKLVDEITAYYSSNGRKPFATIAEFANSGVLQTAINESNINQNIAKFSPAYISQSTILEMLAPYLTTRSDTFTAHVYGSANDSLTGESKVEVWCTATLQRFPERVDGNLALLSEDSQKSDNLFGRRFKIIDLKWSESAGL